ncbi:Marvel domain [Lasallia pustulata]|uniref:Marvel domain n=1 Tax=Lasallia pustulata TaxID=136370 RepID=A0A1W5CVB4_9LECA|nr:Marvel domain [Lasallia pustulata]
MAFKDRVASSSGSFVTWILHAILRFLQFVLALTVAGLYGAQLDDQRKHGGHGDSRWIYAEVVAALSAVTCILYMIPLVRSYLFFAWDLILFILWVALFGLFGKLYIKKNAHHDSSVQKMKNAVWVDLINMLLWLLRRADV